MYELKEILLLKERITIEDRRRRNWGHRKKRPVYISCISRGIPQSEVASVENLLYMYLEGFDPLIQECIENGRPNCAEQLKKVKNSYGTEISTLVGDWSDKTLRFIAQLGDGDAEKKYQQLDRLRKSNLAYYF